MTSVVWENKFSKAKKLLIPMGVTISSFAGAEAVTQAVFGEGTGRIWLDRVHCGGNERVLINCTSSFSGVNSCTHAQDAGVRCPIGKTIIKLQDYGNPSAQG